MKSEPTKLNIVFAIGSYLPRTHTWVYNQLRFFKHVPVLILASNLNPGRFAFPLESHELFSFPDLKTAESSGFMTRVFRRILRLALIDSRFDLLVFTWKAKKSKSSLIHAHFAHIGWKFIPVAGMLKIPLVVSFYGYDYNFLPNLQPKWKKRYRELAERGSLFLTEGEYGGKELIKKGFPPDRVKVHHLGVDIDSIPFKVRNLSQGEVLRLIQVASFVEKKGHRTLIEAMKLLKNEGVIDRVSLTLIGDGPLKQEMVNLTDQYQLNKHITFIDHIPYESLHKELLKYHIFIHPSITGPKGDCEGGAPVVLLDAQATGMPVVSTYHCDIPEEVINGETGILVAEGDSQNLAHAILRFLDEPKLIIEYGAAGRNHAEKNYSAITQTEKLTAIYAEFVRS
jgi:colanic acid/amylovoran biosynthesis glycosyltransferase